MVAATTIDCQGSSSDEHHGFEFNSDEGSNSVVEGFTITNGYADKGGGIACYNHSNPTIANCIITGNSDTAQGGGSGVMITAAR